MRKRMRRAAAMAVAAGTLAASMGGWQTMALAEEGEKEVISIAIQQNANVEDYETNYLTQLVEEEMNVSIEWTYLPADAGDAKTKLSLLINSGETLPDVIIMEMTNNEVNQYGEAGAFLALNDYLNDESKAVNFRAIASEADQQSMLEAMTSPDGNIYGLCNWSPEDFNLTPFRCWINQTWLDALGLEMPTTTEELQTVLTAFATQDPNGNGALDEIALTGCKDAWGGYTPYYLINSFLFYNADMANGGLSVDENGQVIAPFAQEEWRQALEYMNGLCEAGALDPAAFTMDTTSYQALLDQDPNVVGCVCAGGWGYWNGGLENTNFQDFVLLPPMEGPEGIAYAAYYEYAPKMTYYITSSCENPELAFAIGDFFYREDVSYTVRYGEEGVEWSTAEEDLADREALYASSGYDCTVAILDDIWSGLQNKMWYGVGPRYTSIENYRGKDSQAVDGDTRDMDLRALSYSYYGEAHPETILPTLTYTQEESNEISEIMANIEDYVTNNLAEFVTGNRPLSDWDSYLEELEHMGLSRWLELAQNAYDRMAEQ